MIVPRKSAGAPPEKGEQGVDRLSTDVGGNDLTDYGARLRRRGWIVALGLLLGLSAGLAVTAALSKTYTSTTSVLVIPIDGSTGNVVGGRTSGTVNLDTESQLVQSSQVGQAARTLLKSPDAVTDLLAQVSVTVPPNSAVLAIDFLAPTPQAAQQGSHAFAQAYLTDRANQAKQQTDVQVASLQAQLKVAQGELQAATDKAAALVANSPDKLLADAQRTIISNQVNDLLNRLAPLTSAPASPGQIITDAPLPTTASSPIPALNVGAGLVIGLLVGLGVAVVVDRLDHRLRRPSDVGRQVGLPVLATISGGREAGLLLGASQGPAFDRLRNVLAGPNGHSIQVSDPDGRGGSGPVAAQLALSLVRSHGSSLLVVAREGSLLPDELGVTGHPGLAEVLNGTASLPDVCTSSNRLPGVTIVPPGRDPEELERLLQSSTAHEVLAGLAARSPGLVIETLSTGRSAAAQAVAAAADVLVLVAEIGRTDGRDVREAADGAVLLDRSVSGVVLVPQVRRGLASGRRAARTTDTADAGVAAFPAPGPTSVRHAELVDTPAAGGPHEGPQGEAVLPR